MIWSKSKKAIEQLLADSVKDHVDFHMTRYGPGVSYIKSRAWITWDGKEIVNMSNSEWTIALHHKMTDNNHLDFKMAKATLINQGLLARDQFETAIEAYLEQSIEKSLSSDNPITKALSLFDRRLGKRRLKQFRVAETEHPLVRLFYDLRFKAEGLEVLSALNSEDLT